MPNNVNLKLIVGLGNIGPKYEHTRHNMGCDLLFNIADKYRISLNPESKFSGLVGRGNIEGQEVRLVFPTTFMNESGRSVGALCNFFRIAPEEILVLHDDLDLPPGTIRFKFGGGLAGHNGLKSITACLSGAQNYYRLRIGIGHPERSDVINWVLNRPSPQDRDKIDAALDAALLGIGTLFKEGVNKATSFINGFKPL
ncbi:aminoacyl-tRNA hydrolase [uncultured Succinatimonas sp.]|uniref:aminoacyl-tRNA hydrolase n=1 Tax=uncultured Succinatimonas sp. TaxID=1262973 RepID=UPI0025F52001|nr:aminoacyl-tRNA hydrolase [uncultured Succinatimonas sp.]